MRHEVGGARGSGPLAQAGRAVASSRGPQRPVPGVVVLPAVVRRRRPRRARRRRPRTSKAKYYSHILQEFAVIVTPYVSVPVRLRALVLVLHDLHHVGHRVREPDVVVQVVRVAAARGRAPLQRRRVSPSKSRFSKLVLQKILQSLILWRLKTPAY